MSKKKYTRKPHRVKKKRSILSYKGFWLGLLTIITIAGLFYLIIFSTWFQVTEIKIRGNQKVCEQEIKKLIQPKIVQQIINLETRSIFLTNLKEANKSILNKFPLISEVKIKRILPNKVSIEIKERVPVAIFYYQKYKPSVSEIEETEYEKKDNGREIKKSIAQQFFIDKNGIIFKEITNNQQGQYLKIKNLMPIPSIKLGERKFEKKLVSQILEIEQELKKIEIPIKKVLIVSNERLNVKTLENWEIYFNLKDDISTQITRLNLVLTEKIPVEKRKSLKYVDLRFGSRVFFYHQDYKKNFLLDYEN